MYVVVKKLYSVTTGQCIQYEIEHRVIVSMIPHSSVLLSDVHLLLSTTHLPVGYSQLDIPSFSLPYSLTIVRQCTSIARRFQSPCTALRRSLRDFYRIATFDGPDRNGLNYVVVCPVYDEIWWCVVILRQNMRTYDGMF